MMFFKTAIAAVVVALVGSASARPYIREAQAVQRDIQVIGVRSIPVEAPEIAVRGLHMRQIPEEQPTRSNGGQIVAYKREIVPRWDEGQLEELEKRQNIPAEEAVTAPDGVVRIYKRVEEPVLEGRAGQIPSEIAVRSVNGVIERYE
ncbi:hypothetical protein CPB86DRAFT_868473 [Serendipita vermifera]|nr:hypothetical protein CPB86DRAFT_868473 [Serendipita vermifera]